MQSQYQKSYDWNHMNSFHNSNACGHVLTESPVRVFPKFLDQYRDNLFHNHNSNYNWNQVTQNQSINSSMQFGSASKISQFQDFSTPTNTLSQHDFQNSSSEKGQRLFLRDYQPKPFNSNLNVNNSQPPIPDVRPQQSKNKGKAFNQAFNQAFINAKKQPSNRKLLTKQNQAQSVKRRLFPSNLSGNQQQNISNQKNKINNKLPLSFLPTFKDQWQKILCTQSFTPSQSSVSTIQKTINSPSFQNQNSENLATNNNISNNNNNNFQNLLKFQKQQAASDPTYKTELCKNWQEFGSCRYSTKCRFAHGPHELLNKQNKHLNYKTKDCKKFSNGYCPYGFRCLFKHETRSEQGLKMGKFQTALRYLGFNLFEMKRLSVFKQISLSTQQRQQQETQSFGQIIQPYQCNIEHIQEIKNYNRLIQVAV